MLRVTLYAVCAMLCMQLVVWAWISGKGYVLATLINILLPTVLVPLIIWITSRDASPDSTSNTKGALLRSVLSTWLLFSLITLGLDLMLRRSDVTDWWSLNRFLLGLFVPVLPLGPIMGMTIFCEGLWNSRRKFR
jgi:hypothetical protein